MKPAEFERLWSAIEPLLPLDPPKPKSGRPRVSDRQVLRGILFILETGIPWERLPREMGCGPDGIASRIARRCVESSERLGQYRWIVERSMSWLNRFRKLRIRYERCANAYIALCKLACCLITLRFVDKFC